MASRFSGKEILLRLMGVTPVPDFDFLRQLQESLRHQKYEQRQDEPLPYFYQFDPQTNSYTIQYLDGRIERVSVGGLQNLQRSPEPFWRNRK